MQTLEKQHWHEKPDVKSKKQTAKREITLKLSKHDIQDRTL